MIDPLKNRFLGQPNTSDQLQALINAAVLAEREACASVAEKWESVFKPGTEARLLGHQEAALDIAAAIRKRSDADVTGAAPHGKETKL